MGKVRLVSDEKVARTPTNATTLQALVHLSLEVNGRLEAVVIGDGINQDDSIEASQVKVIDSSLEWGAIKYGTEVREARF